MSDVYAQREALTEVPSSKKFLMFDATTALAKARADMLQRKASEERARVEAESKEDGQPRKGKGKESKTEEEGLSKRAKKRAKQNQKKKEQRERAEKLQRTRNSLHSPSLRLTL